MALHLSLSLREDNSQAKIHKKHLKNTVQDKFLRGIFLHLTEKKHNYTFPYSPRFAVEGCGIHIFRTTASVDNEKAQKYIIPLFDSFPFLFIPQFALYTREFDLNFVIFKFRFFIHRKKYVEKFCSEFYTSGVIVENLACVSRCTKRKKRAAVFIRRTLFHTKSYQ